MGFTEEKVKKHLRNQAVINSYQRENKENQIDFEPLEEDYEISDDIEEMPSAERVLTREFDNAKGDAFDGDRADVSQDKNFPKITKQVKNLSTSNTNHFLATTTFGKILNSHHNFIST